MSVADLVASLTAGLMPEQLAVMQNENHDVEVYTVAVVFSALAIASVILRLTSRHLKSAALMGIDDALMVGALIIALAQTIWICVGIRDYGLGRHLWTLNEEQFANFNKLWFGVGEMQPTILFLSKVAVLILFYRIFIQRGFRLAALALGAITTLWWLGTLLADILICLPPAYNWNPTIEAQCGNKQLLWIIPPIPWIITDLAVVILPLPVIWELHMPLFQRMGLVALFLLGGFATISSCVRYATLFDLYQQKDLTYNIGPATVWTIIESNIIVISASLIVSKPYLVKVYPERLVSRVRVWLSSDKSPKSGSPTQSRRPLFASWQRQGSKPPAISRMSLGAPFGPDLEKQISFGDSSRLGRVS